MLRVHITLAGTAHPTVHVETATAARAAIGDAVEQHAAGLADDERTEFYTTTIADLNAHLGRLADAVAEDLRWFYLDANADVWVEPVR